MDVRRVTNEAELKDALAVRREVFVEEQGVPEHRELDGRDDEATHLVAYAEGDVGDDDGATCGDTGGSEAEPVGATRLRAYDGSTGKVERVAVRRSHRGEGLGRALMDEIEDVADDRGYDGIVLHAQAPVVEFYERLGYEVTGEPFEDAGIAHREMRKRL